MVSVAACTEINRRLRAAGFTVHEAPGWQTRGRSMDTAFVGGLVHHTASAYNTALPGEAIYNLLVNGRSDLAGPLCNYAGNDDGSFTVIAAGVANHAGASGGRSMGPLPVTSTFNRRVLGLEIVYPGDKPMTDGQYDAATAWARVVADVVGGGDIERVRAHAETSVTGKWDPGYAPGKTIDMAAFRAAARQGVDDMNEAQNAALSDVWKLLRTGEGYQTSNLARQLGYVLNQAVQAADNATAKATVVDGKVSTLFDAVTRLSSKLDSLTTGQVDVNALAEALRPLITAAVADELAKRLAS